MQAQAKRAALEEVSLTFKRHILDKSSGFASEPMADLYRVHLLGMMLNRYEELGMKGLSEENCRQRVMAEFADIADRMREEGFETHEEAETLSRWPQLTEEAAACYIRERDAYTHRIALGVLMCVACLVPLMVLGGLSEMLYGFGDDAIGVLGLIGMFGMIGTGIYTIVSAARPKDEKRVKRGRFSLAGRLRRKLEGLREAADGRARRRKGKGVAMIVTSMVPLLMSTALSEIWYSWPLLGVGGMFLMIAAGVYELIVADGEKKTMQRLLDQKE